MVGVVTPDEWGDYAITMALLHGGEVHRVCMRPHGMTPVFIGMDEVFIERYTGLYGRLQWGYTKDIRMGRVTIGPYKTKHEAAIAYCHRFHLIKGSKFRCPRKSKPSWWKLFVRGLTMLLTSRGRRSRS